MIRSDIAVPAIRALRVEQRVDRADQARQVDHQEQRQEDRGDEGQHEAEPGDDHADHAAGRAGDALRDLLHVRLRGLRRLAVLVDPRAERRVGGDVLDHAGQRLDEVPEAPGEWDEEEQNDHDTDDDEPEHEHVAQAPRPERKLALHQPDHRLEHERDEQRQESVITASRM